MTLSSTLSAALATLAVLGLAAANPAAAQVTVNFGAAQTISGDTDVANTGTTVIADAFANGISGTTTVNGVTFTNNVQFSDTNNGVTLATAGLTDAYNGFAVGFTPFGNLSAPYQDVLRGAIFNSGAAATFTITGLTSGHTYLAQFFVADPRGATARTDTLSGGTTLAFNVGNGTVAGDSSHGEGGDGQFANASFTADGTGTATFLVTSSGGSTQDNAFQVRDLGAAPEPSQFAAFGLGVLGVGALALKARKRAVA
jgi:hypothetical protein